VNNQEVVNCLKRERASRVERENSPLHNLGTRHLYQCMQKWNPVLCDQGKASGICPSTHSIKQTHKFHKTERRTCLVQGELLRAAVDVRDVERVVQPCHKDLGTAQRCDLTTWKAAEVNLGGTKQSVTLANSAG
jgi:hypothetical protein